jgi:hypothetical protein
MGQKMYKPRFPVHTVSLVSIGAFSTTGCVFEMFMATFSGALGPECSVGAHLLPNLFA